MRVHFLGYLILSLLLIGSCAESQESAAVGQVAPVIKVGQWLNEAPDLKDKVLVVDFWFVNCGPCIASIPHLNSLAEAYQGKDVTFLAITDDSRKQVLDFQKRRKISMKAHVGIDRMSRLEKRFGVTAYPQSFIIDKKGVIVWSGSPLSLSSSIINEYIGDSEIAIKGELVDFEGDNELLVIRKSKEKAMVAKTDRAAANTVRSVYIGVSLQTLIAQLRNHPLYLVKVPTREADMRYDLTFENMAYAGDLAQHNEKLLTRVLKELNYGLLEEPSNVEGYRLIPEMSRLSRYQKDAGNAYTNDESIKGVFSLQEIALKLSEVFGKLVVYEGDSAVKYRFELDLTDHDKLRKHLEEKYGIGLKRETVEAVQLNTLPISPDR